MEKIFYVILFSIFINGCSSFEDTTYSACYPLMGEKFFHITQTGFDEGIIEFRKIHKKSSAVHTSYCAINKKLSIAATASEKESLIIFIKYGTLYGESVNDESVRKYPLIYRKI